MIDLFALARSKGEAALRRAAWAFAGAGLIVLALGFAAAAGVAALEIVAPDYVALAAGAAGLIICAAVCFARARPPGDAAPPPTAAEGSLALDAPGPADADDWRGLLNAALAREAREKPARAAAIAAIAGLILGAIEALDEGRSRS
jgi:vacuolar-type H+-ATPase subunit I/STV1